jgi:hypothetical protein
MTNGTNIVRGLDAARGSPQRLGRVPVTVATR